MTECTICLNIFFWDYCDTVDPSQPYVRSYCGIIFVASNKPDLIVMDGSNLSQNLCNILHKISSFYQAYLGQIPSDQIYAFF